MARKNCVEHLGDGNARNFCGIKAQESEIKRPENAFPRILFEGSSRRALNSSRERLASGAYRESIYV